MKESTRAHLYRISNATIPILVAYGVIAEQHAAVWLGLANALFATVLATVNTSTEVK